MAKAKKEKLNPFMRLVRYTGDVRSEMKRVVWPKRPEIVSSSMVVIVTLVFFVTFTLLVDTVSTAVIQFIAGIGG